MSEMILGKSVVKSSGYDWRMILSGDGSLLAAAYGRDAWVFDTRSGDRVWEDSVADGALFISRAPQGRFALKHAKNAPSLPNVRRVELWSLESTPVRRAVMTVEDDPFGVDCRWEGPEDFPSPGPWYFGLDFPWMVEVASGSARLFDIWPLVTEDAEGDNPAQVGVLGYGPLASVTHFRGGPVRVVHLPSLRAAFGSSNPAYLDITTVDFAAYDVVVIASDFGGWLRQAELDALTARSEELIDYVNAGGGLVGFAESGGGSNMRPRRP
jgi:hypothetical protein